MYCPVKKCHWDNRDTCRSCPLKAERLDQRIYQVVNQIVWQVIKRYETRKGRENEEGNFS